jgi:hypothetical protein
MAAWHCAVCNRGMSLHLSITYLSCIIPSCSFTRTPARLCYRFATLVVPTVPTALSLFPPQACPPLACLLSSRSSGTHAATACVVSRLVSTRIDRPAPLRLSFACTPGFESDSQSFQPRRTVQPSPHSPLLIPFHPFPAHCPAPPWSITGMRV